jgi:HSP20 family molecular chaperone IbpA
VDRDHIRATFKSGVMRLELPKKEEVKPKEIKIEIEK